MAVQLCFLLLCAALVVQPAAAGVPPKSMGCYGDGDGHGGSGPRLFPAAKQPDMPANNATPAACAAACHKASPQSALVGIEDATQCMCGDASLWAKVRAARVPDDKCTATCNPAGSGNCGGGWMLSVYWIGSSPAPPVPPSPPPPPPGKPVAPPAPKPVFDCDPAWPMCNTSLSLDERIADFMSSMSTSNKMNMLGQRCGGSDCGTRDGKNLFSRGYNWWTEDLHGLRVGCPKDGQGRPFGRCPTQFPEANLLGCSFNESLFSMLAEAISTEDRVYYR
jgi:hypothetical protein